jgi:hypothetical protein
MNLFYSYNESNQLIENNLTRAWIVSLKLLSGMVRNHLLKALLARPLGVERLPDFSQARFALQAHMSKEISRQSAQRFILAIATERFEEDQEEPDEAVDTGSASTMQPSGGGSIPDGWIYEEKNYVYLVESKIGTNPLGAPQLFGEARDWFGFDEQEARGHILALTWYDVMAAIERTIQGARSGKLLLNGQEHLILNEFGTYLGFFGYRLFRGFRLSELGNKPDFSVLPSGYSHAGESDQEGSLTFSGMREPPKLKLRIPLPAV